MPAPAPLQQASANTAGAAAASLSKAFAGNVTLNSRIVVFAGSQSSGASPVDHTVSHTGTATVDGWVSVVGPINSGDSPAVRYRVWTAYVTGAGSMTVKVTSASGTCFFGICLEEYPSLFATTASCVDVSHAATGTTTAGAQTISTGATGATGAANELAKGFYADAGGASNQRPTAGTGYGHLLTAPNGTDVQCNAEDKDSGASGGTQTATFGLNASEPSGVPWVSIVAVFKLAATAPAYVESLPRRRRGTGLLAPRGRVALHFPGAPAFAPPVMARHMAVMTLHRQSRRPPILPAGGLPVPPPLRGRAPGGGRRSLRPFPLPIAPAGATWSPPPPRPRVVAAVLRMRLAPPIPPQVVPAVAPPWVPPMTSRPPRVGLLRLQRLIMPIPDQIILVAPDWVPPMVQCRLPTLPRVRPTAQLTSGPIHTPPPTPPVFHQAAWVVMDGVTLNIPPDCLTRLIHVDGTPQ